MDVDELSDESLELMGAGCRARRVLLGEHSRESDHEQVGELLVRWVVPSALSPKSKAATLSNVGTLINFHESRLYNDLYAIDEYHSEWSQLSRREADVRAIQHAAAIVERLDGGDPPSFSNVHGYYKYYAKPPDIY